MFDDAALERNALVEPRLDRHHALQPFLRHVRQAAQSREIELHRGQQAAQLVVQLACDARALVFPGVYQVAGHFSQLGGALAHPISQEPPLFRQRFVAPLQLAPKQHQAQNRGQRQNVYGQPTQGGGLVDRIARALLHLGGTVQQLVEFLPQLLTPGTALAADGGSQRRACVGKSVHVLLSAAAKFRWPASARRSARCRW